MVMAVQTTKYKDFKAELIEETWGVNANCVEKAISDIVGFTRDTRKNDSNMAIEALVKVIEGRKYL